MRLRSLSLCFGHDVFVLFLLGEGRGHFFSSFLFLGEMGGGGEGREVRVGKKRCSTETRQTMCRSSHLVAQKNLSVLPDVLAVIVCGAAAIPSARLTVE